MSAELALALERLVALVRPRAVLEFGAGTSSLVLARAVAGIGGGQLTSVDHMPRFARDAWDAVQRVPAVDARLVPSRLRSTMRIEGVSYRFVDAGPALAGRAPFDLVFIDAPQFYYGRDGTMHQAHPHLAPGALVVLDDAGRPGERRALRRWLRLYPGLVPLVVDPAFGGRGCAVLLNTGAKAQRALPLAAFLGSVVESAWGLRHVVRRRRTRRLAASAV